MDLNLLSLFAAVAKAKNFSAAAHVLGVERSSVSRGVATLERVLGTQLFSRTTRKIALTSAGAAFLKQIEDPLSAMGDAVASASERSAQLSGLLRISMAVDMAISFMPAVFAGFHARYPDVQLDLRVENRKADLVEEGIDVALRVVLAPQADSSLLAVKLSRLEFRAYASPAYVSRNGYPGTVEEAARLDWLAFRDGDVAGFPLPVRKVSIVADDMLFLHQAALSARGIALLPTFLTHSDVASGRLIEILPAQMFGAGELYLLHGPAKRLSRRARAFSDFMIRYFEANPLTFSDVIAG